MRSREMLDRALAKGGKWTKGLTREDPDAGNARARETEGEKVDGAGTRGLEIFRAGRADAHTRARASIQKCVAARGKNFFCFSMGSFTKGTSIGSPRDLGGRYSRFLSIYKDLY